MICFARQFKSIKNNFLLLDKRAFNTTIRTMQQAKPDRSDWQTVICSNGTIACWHPPKQFPYEHSRPFNMEAAQKEKEQFLKRRLDVDLSSKKGPDDYALREIFHTNLQEWQPIYREKRLYKAIVPEATRPTLSNPLEPPSAPTITGGDGWTAISKQQPKQIGVEDDDNRSSESENEKNSK